MKLVIVESPNKCKTIAKYLGEGYRVEASVGHIREVANTGHDNLGVDVNNDFKVDYIIEAGKIKTVKELKRLVKKSDEVILASDPDREGEAIAWHLTQVLDLPVETTTRWRFHEITRNSINHEKDNPSTIDMNLVHAQEARRIIDRISGYKLSDLVRGKTRTSLANESAGRVQSATLKFIVDREFEILKFVPEEYWTISGDFGENHINANLVSYSGSSLDKKIKNKDDANNIENILNKGTYIIESIEENNKSRNTKPAFTTSTLQQEAFNVLGFSIQRTMKVAKELFEGVNVEDTLVGLITYIRTDSNRLAPEFIKSANAYIKDNFGDEYIGYPHVTTSKSDKVQDAHEAIRPTDITMTPSKVKKYLSSEQYKIYELVYNRALASLMSARVEKVKIIKINNSGYIFETESRSMVFDGYSKVYGKYESYGKELSLKDDYKVGKEIDLNELKKEQKFTHGPYRYTEANAVHTMEEMGIGRPSTYVTTIKKLLEREYVQSIKGTLRPTLRGMYVSCRLSDNFPEITGPSFTSSMEQNLDKIADKEISELEVLKNFYNDFEESFKVAESKMFNNYNASTSLICPNCGSHIIFKNGTFGPYMQCEKCDYKQKLQQDKIIEGEMCPKCGSQIVERYSFKMKKTFQACSNYPNCNYIKDDTQYVDGSCPKCGNKLRIVGNGRKKFVGCLSYPNCDYMQDLKGNPIEKRNTIDDTNAPICPVCKKGRLVERKGRYGTFTRCTRCKYNPNSKKNK